MHTVLETLINDVPQLGTALSYTIVCSLLIIGGLGLPAPEDIALLLAGVVCHLGLANLPTMIVVTFLLIMSADMLLFWFGRRYGHHVPRLPIIRHYLTEARLARAENYFQAHGGKTLFIARFLPGLRSVVWFSAGACRTPVWKMLVYDGSAAIISVPTFIFIGYVGANQVEKVRHWTHLGQISVVLLVVGLTAAAVIIKYLRRKKVTTSG